MEILFWGLGAIGFWIFFGLICLILIALVEHERVGWSSLLLLGTLLFFQLGTSFKPFSLLVAHPVWGSLTVLGYFLAGAAWCIWKWWFYVKAKRREYDEEKQRFLERHGVSGTTIPENLRTLWRNEHGRGGYISVTPMPSRHKGRIMTWLIYWPWSFVWTIVDDPIKRMFRAIYDQIKSTLEAISRKAFRGVDDELAPPSNPRGGSDGGPRHGRNRSRRGQAADYDEEGGQDVLVVEHGQPVPDIAHSENGFILEDEGEDESGAASQTQATSRSPGGRPAK